MISGFQGEHSTHRRLRKRLDLLSYSLEKWVSYMTAMQEKRFLGVSDQVRHKLTFAVTEDGLKVEILDIRKECLYYPCTVNKGADRLSSQTKHIVD